MSKIINFKRFISEGLMRNQFNSSKVSLDEKSRAGAIKQYIEQNKEEIVPTLQDLLLRN